MSASPSPSFANMNGHSTSKNVIQFQFKSFSPAPSATGSSVSAPKGTSSPNPLGTRDGEAYGVPGPGPSSDSTKEYTNVAYNPTHNERIIDHLYNAGFQLGEFADTLLHARQNRYQLHAIILSRSPYLAHLISTTPNTGGYKTIYVPLESFPEVTDQGFSIALGYLYSSVSLSNLTQANARGVLAAGCLLGGLEDLCHYAYHSCHESISVETIDEWINFVDSLPSEDGMTTPSEVPPPTILGPYAYQLRSDVFNFLVITLPSSLDVHSATSNGRDTLLNIFSRLGFDLFKKAIESPLFQIGSDQERFRFAKAAIDMRKHTRGAGTEETVVLAFGGSKTGSSVLVTRKMKKRALFKTSCEGKFPRLGPMIQNNLQSVSHHCDQIDLVSLNHMLLPVKMQLSPKMSITFNHKRCLDSSTPDCANPRTTFGIHTETRIRMGSPKDLGFAALPEAYNYCLTYAVHTGARVSSRTDNLFCMAPVYDLYFTGSRGNPRQCIILGEDVEPIFYRFETPEVFMTDTKTMIYRNQDEVVAAFEWSAGTYLGLCNIRNRQSFPMSQLVLPGSSSNARAFFFQGSKFEWRRLREDPYSYDLFHVPPNVQSVRIAFFRKIDQQTPVGPAHGFLQYTFTQPFLLLESLLALCLNRWMDVHSM
ncbi:btb poz domain btb2 [Pyrrhoderma noxium]|uniref:Btb poz domain btb2 n=1 Tax=Pyrrhoderma noxium TaxID=2282107 RepID=A0A286UXN9_9AGAM|nr:btb poz domain btb2 [Pyrrhoderma noxium]